MKHVAFVFGFMILILIFYETEPVSKGMHIKTKPHVYRMWKDANFPVPRSKWEKFNFVVHDFNHTTAYELVKSRGYKRVWDRLPHYSSKSDLFRYVVIFSYGGWYADADVEPKKGIVSLSTTRQTVFFNEACGSLGFNRLKYQLGISTITHSPQYKGCLFSLPKNSPVLRFALQKIMQTSKNKQPWSIPEVIDYTGPGKYF